MLKQSALVLLCLAFVSSSAVAQDVLRKEVTFPPGKQAVTVSGSIKGRQSLSYTIGAEAGQVLRVELHGNRSTYFNVYEPGRGPGDQALAASDIESALVPKINQFRAALPTSGVYTVNVYLVRAVARRNTKSNFKIEFALSAQKADAPVKADLADGLQGGPDFWRVTEKNVAVTREMARGSAVAMRVDENTVLRNRGCRMADGQRRCKIELPNDPSKAGWIDGRALRESAPPSDALVAGTAFNATGEIPCALAKGQPTSPCKFGVERQGLGKANVTVFLPGGGQRIIRFDNGVPAGSDAPGGARLSFTHQADLFLISINAERFEIPEAVVHGG